MSARDEEQSVRETYERVPYASALQHQTHPDHLAAIAMLRGLETASPANCRILELGCADGGNVLPAAAELTGSHFTGLDLSPRQIETGRAQVADLGLTNVDLRTGSILDLDASLGTFDFIVCHGVFSWVDHHVQDKILAVCRENLAPNGVAYVSYNTYPAWHLRRMMREILLFHTRGIDDQEERAARGLEFIRFLSGIAGQSNDPYAVFLRSSREHLDEYAERTSYLVHEYFERSNEPMYFRDFAARAAAQDLQYLGDADADATDIDHLPPAVADQLRGFASDPLDLEQYVDLVVNRTFRRTLLCHASAALDRAGAHDRIRGMHAASGAKPVTPAPSLADGTSEGFKTERGRPFSSSHPVAKAALVALSAIWPRSASFDELLGTVRARLREAHLPAHEAEETLPDLLDALFWSGVVELNVVPPECTNEVSEKPRASKLSRWQAARGQALVINQRRRLLKLDDEVARFLLTKLDGTRDRGTLLRLLEQEVALGRLDVAQDGQTVRDPARFSRVLQGIVEHHLRRNAELALLAG